MGLWLSSVLSQPWRQIPANNRGNLNFVKSYTPQHPEVQHLRILLHGQIGAGKSSFINSVDSVLHGEIMGRALTDDNRNDTRSFTKTYKNYRFLRESDPNNLFGFSFNDIVGLQESEGVRVDDVILALKGHVKDGYKFNPSSLREGDEGYNPSPTLQDRVHVLVSVLAADNQVLLTEKMQKKMREIRDIASELGIPQLAILTKCDIACPAVAKGMANLYKSKRLKGMADELATKLGIPLNCIFLVKNYEKVANIRDDVDAPILCALRQIIRFGDAFLSDQI